MGKPVFLNQRRVGQVRVFLSFYLSLSTSRSQGFGLGFAVALDPVQMGVACGVGQCTWGGMASTSFVVDPAESLAAVMLTQLVPSATFDLRRQLQALLYSPIVD